MALKEGRIYDDDYGKGWLVSLNEHSSKLWFPYSYQLKNPKYYSVSEFYNYFIGKNMHFSWSSIPAKFLKERIDYALKKGLKPENISIYKYKYEESEIRYILSIHTIPHLDGNHYVEFKLCDTKHTTTEYTTYEDAMYAVHIVIDTLGSIKGSYEIVYAKIKERVDTFKYMPTFSFIYELGIDTLLSGIAGTNRCAKLDACFYERDIVEGEPRTIKITNYLAETPAVLDEYMQFKDLKGLLK